MIAEHTRRRASAAGGPARSSAAWLAALVVLALGLYWRAPLLGFAGDDALVLYHLKRLGGIMRPAGFFTALDFFSYYRPIGFLTFAADAAVSGLRPGWFHVTNVVLHAANGLLVFALARRLMTSWAAALAAALFIVHTSNQEAVYWISARFDLLATMFVLVTVLLATRERRTWAALSLLTFAVALLSKEAALSAPLIVGAYEVFVRRTGPARVVVVLGSMLVVIAGYAVLRSAIGGLDPTGGISRLPKAAMLCAGVGVLMALSRFAWERSWSMIAEAKAIPKLVGTGVIVVIAAAAWLVPAAGASIREKLSFAGFAGFYLFSPVVAPAPPPFFLDPATSVYWAGGLAAVATASVLLFLGRRRLVTDGVWLFILFATAGALLPVSSLTEGQRYLYLGSIGVSLGAAKFVSDSVGRRRQVTALVLGLVVAISAWQVQVKGADWAWATGMLSRGVALVNADLPGCGAGDVVFVVAPVGIRGVYSHFYHQTFSQDGGCEPGSYRAVARMVAVDEALDVQWVAPRTLLVRAPHYAGNFVLSRDLREYTVEQRSAREARFRTPLGIVVSKPEGHAQQIVIELSPDVDFRRTRFYYFAQGEVRRVPPMPAVGITPQ